MQIWEIAGQRGGIGPDGAEVRELRYIQAPSEPHAREIARRFPLHNPTLRPVRGEDIPKGAEVVPYDRSVAVDPLIRISESPLIHSPVITIALGVLLGGLLSSCLVGVLVMFMGGSLRIGR